MAEPVASKDEMVQESKELHQTINSALKSEQGGTKVHVFNPDMPAEQKKAAALGDQQVPNISKVPPLTTDIGSTDTKKIAESLANAPTVTRLPLPDTPKGTPPLRKENGSAAVKDGKQGKTPGSFVGGPIKGVPGWTSFSNLPNPGDEAAMAEFKKTHNDQEIEDLFYNTRSSNGEDNDFIAQFISEKYFGEWFHNCGVVFVAIFFTWLLIKIRLGLVSCLIVGAFFATYYRTSIKRTRRNARDDMQRQVSMNRLENDIETVGWMNLFMSRFWLIFEPVLSAQVIGQVDAILAENTPSFLDSIRMSSFTLGTKAPRVDGIKVYPSSAPDVVCMDWSLSFIPNDILDMTQRELQNKVNPKIVLTIRVGKGMIGAGMPVLLEDISFSGTIRIKLKLFNEMPHVKTVQVSFLEKPHFDYVLKPVGGDTFGFDINNIPGLETFIKDQVHSNLGPMMYAPNVFTLDVAAMMSGTDVDAANGVLAVTIYSANNLKPNDLFGSLDPYCVFKVGNVHNPELARTTAIENTANPKWNETHFVLLNNLTDVLLFQILDRNQGRKDVEVGVANLDLKDVEAGQNAIEGLNLVALRSGKPVGEIKADVHYFPVAKPEKKEDGTVIPPAESNSGVCRFTLLDCQDIGAAVTEKKGGVPLVGGLPGISSVPLIGSHGGDVNAYAIIKVNGQEKLKTNVFKRSANPRWNKFIEVFVADKPNMIMEVIIKNAVDYGDDTVLGTWSSNLVDMENQLVTEKKDYWNLENGTGKIHLDMTWKPVPLTGFSAGLTRGAYRPPIGVVRVKLNSAKNIKNVEMLTGKSDPYVRIMSGLQPRAQTEAILDNLNPVWDTALYVPIHSLREDLLLEVMDYNDTQNDKFLGMTDLLIKDLVVEKKTEDDQSIYQPLPAVQRNAELVNKERKTGRGQLNYEAAFFPTLALAKQATKKELEAEKEDETEAAKVVTDAKDELLKDAPAIEPTGPPVNDLNGVPIIYTLDQKINLLGYQSGVLSVTVHDVTLSSSKHAVVEFLLDSNDAQFRTSDMKGTQLIFQESGDAFVKEMDFSRLVVRVREANNTDENEHLGFWASRVEDIVKSIQNRKVEEGKEGTDDVQKFKLLDSDGGLINLSFKFVPVVNFKLDPSESLENQGNLTVTAISASGLRAADKSGTSDPYCIFTVNDEKVHKTETYKKQLNPIFQKETFVVPIVQRNKANFEVKIFDWDQIGTNELLAEGSIPIANLESFAAQEINVQLRGGTILLRLKWEPQLLARKRVGTILGSTTRILTSGPGLAGNAVGMGLGAGGKVVTGAVGGGARVVGGGAKTVGGAVGGGIGAIGSGFGAIGRGLGKIGGSHGKEAPVAVQADGTPAVVDQPIVAVPENGDGVMHTSEPRHSVLSNSVISTSTSGESRPRSVFEGKNATIRVTLIAARGLKGMNRDKTSDPYVRARLGKHTVYKTKHLKKTCDPEWNESFVAKASGTSTINFMVRDHNTLADANIGEVSFNVSEHVDEGRSYDGWLPLTPEGNGEVHITVEVVP